MAASTHLQQCHTVALANQTAATEFIAYINCVGDALTDALADAVQNGLADPVTYALTDALAHAFAYTVQQPVKGKA